MLISHHDFSSFVESCLWPWLWTDDMFQKFTITLRSSSCKTPLHKIDFYTLHLWLLLTIGLLYIQHHPSHIPDTFIWISVIGVLWQFVYKRSNRSLTSQLAPNINNILYLSLSVSFWPTKWTYNCRAGRWPRTFTQVLYFCIILRHLYFISVFPFYTLPQLKCCTFYSTTFIQQLKSLVTVKFKILHSKNMISV